MKLIFLSFGLLASGVFFQSNLYDLNVQSVSGSTLLMSSYSGKKIAVVVFDPAAVNNSFLHSIDSLSGNKLKIIAVPANELGMATTASLITLSQSFSSSMVMLRPCYVKKNAGVNQEPLLKWLTNVSENGHFDNDVSATGQIFLVNQSGVLYAVLNSDTDMQIIKQAFGQNIN